MKAFSISILVLIYSINLYSQWEMMNIPHAVPEITAVVYHPEGNIIAVTKEREVFQSSTNQNDWNKIATVSKDVFIMSIAPNGTIYAGVTGGYLSSTDKGITWNESILGPATGHRIHDILFDSDGYIYMISNAWSNQAPIYISSNNGTSWYNPSGGLPTSNYRLIGIEKDSSENIYVFTESSFPSLFKSTTKGINWELVPGNQDYLVLGFKIDSKNRIYIRGAYKISKTEDFGITYTELYNGRFSKIVIDNDDNVNVFLTHINDGIARIDTGYTNANILFSSDSGLNWELKGIAGIQANDLIRINDTLYLATSNGLRKSSFYDNNWSLCFEKSDQATKVNDILRLPTTGRLLLATKRGIMLSDDNSSTWLPVSLVSNINILSKTESSSIYAVDYDLFRSDDNGLNWLIPYPVATFWRNQINNIFINDTGYVFIAKGRGKNETMAIKSVNSGASWLTLWHYVFAGNTNGNMYSILESSGGKLFLSTSFMFYTYPPLPSYGRIYFKVPEQNWSVLLESRIAHNMYLFNNNIYIPIVGFGTSPLGIYKSSDDGVTFVAINNGLPDLNVTQLVLKPEVFFALTGDGIYRSLDQGNYWFRLDHTGLSGNLLKIYYDHNKIFYAITDEGVFKFSGNIPVELSSFTASSSKNTVQLSWSTASELNNYGFEIERSNDQVDWRTIGFREGKGTTTQHQNYTFTDDLFGVNSHKLYYRLKQIDYDGRFEYSNVLEINVASLSFALHQNYPNPFNPSTKISWQSPVGGWQTLKVFDVLGREVATLVDEYRDAGYHEVEFLPESRIKNPASGVYFYQLKAGNYIDSKKMILLR